MHAHIQNGDGDGGQWVQTLTYWSFHFFLNELFLRTPSPLSTPLPFPPPQHTLYYMYISTKFADQVDKPCTPLIGLGAMTLLKVGKIYNGGIWKTFFVFDDFAKILPQNMTILNQILRQI